jgi:hypothetical protein
MTKTTEPIRTGPSRWLEMAVYAAVAIGGVAPAFAKRGLATGDGVDMYGTLWFYWWIQDCVVHLRNPSFTNLFFYPLGKDIFAHTGNNFVDALISVPFQWIFGFPRYESIFVAVIFFLDAVTFRSLARRVVDRDTSVGFLRGIWGGPRLTWAAFVAVLLWQTNSYILFELTCGRLTQALLWFLPLSVERFLAVEDTLREEGRIRWRSAILSGFLMGLQAWTYWFMGYFMALFFAWLTILALWGVRRNRRSLWRMAAATGVVAAASVAVVAPAGIGMWLRASTGTVPGLAGGDSGVFDLPRSLGNNVAASLHGYLLMEVWGAPMFGFVTWIVAIVLALAFGRQRLRWVGGAVVAVIFALGPSIPPWHPISDHPIKMFHYLLAYHLLPFFDRLWFPYRLVVIAFLCVSLAAGTAWARIFPWLQSRFSAWKVAKGRVARLAPVLVPVICALLLAVNLVEQNGRYVWPFVTRDVDPPKIFFFLRDHAKDDGKVEAVIHVPIGVTQTSIVWQTIHHQPMFGGMGENAPLLWPEGFAARLRNDFVRFLYNVTRQPSETKIPKDDSGQKSLVSEGFRWLVLHREILDSPMPETEATHLATEAEEEALPFLVTQHLREVLGEPVAVEGGIVLWDLLQATPPLEGMVPTEYDLTHRIWNPSEQPDYERVLRERGRMPGGGGPKREHSPGRNPG